MRGNLGTIHPGAVVENRHWMDWGRYNKIDYEDRQSELQTDEVCFFQWPGAAYILWIPRSIEGDAARHK